MSNKNDSIDAESNREIVITRVFDAPRELVKAWTDPKHVAQWWGPKGFTTQVTVFNSVLNCLETI